LIGIDIIEIDRIEDASKNPNFLDHIFTKIEIEYIKEKRGAPQTIAGMFAAKEAVAKALGKGFCRGFTHKDLEITHDNYGAPQVILHGAAGKILEKTESIYLSVSHCKSYAAAVAIVK
jgi:holo-[acyl-carrier protein] synthase